MNKIETKTNLDTLIKLELLRQKAGWNLIASENKCYSAIYKLIGSHLQNKYAEGIPTKRYYTGCKYIDEIEILAAKNGTELFEAEYINNQPHCGSSANLIAYQAICRHGDTILSMDFNAGGHLSHGYKRNITGQIYNFIHYNVHPITHIIDYDQIEDMIKKNSPRVVISGGSSYSRLIDYKYIYSLTQKYGILHLVDMSHIAGLIAAKIIPSPIPFADIVTSTSHKTLRGPRGAFIISRHEWKEKIEKAVLPGIQGGPFINIIAAKAWLFNYAKTEQFRNYQKKIIQNTQTMINIFQKNNIPIISNGSDNHLFIIDLSKFNKHGKTIADLLERENIFVNHNAIPYDKLPPSQTSGIRIGTPFITAQKKTTSEIIAVTEKIISIINEYKDNN